MNAPLKSLTPHQEAEARSMAYNAFMKDMTTRYPKPEPPLRDLVHDNPHVVKALVNSISVMPVFLAIILVSSMVISADKTFKAFSSAAANREPVWTVLVGVLGVLMTEGSMVYVAFAATRQRLQKGLSRQVVTLPSLVRGVKVRLGLAPVPDADTLPDQNLERFSRLIFILVLAANIFTAALPLLRQNDVTMSLVDQLSLGFAVFMGAVAPFALHSVGSQLAELSFDLYRQENDRLKRELEAEWQAEMDRQWAEIEPELTKRALHYKFVLKNNLDFNGPSPYWIPAEDPNGPFVTRRNT